MELILKPVPPEDYAAYHKMIDNPNIARMTGSIPHPVDIDFVVERMETRAKEEAEQGNRAERGIYVDGKLVGGALHFPGEDGNQEIGYFVGEDHWGKGYATKAAQAIIDLARNGAAILVISQDLDELFTIADCIAVISEGTLSETTPVEELTVEKIGLRMGEKSKQEVA